MFYLPEYSKRFLCNFHLRLATALTFLPVAASAQQTVVASPQAHPPVPPVRATAGYGALPLAFEANRGQTDASVRFMAHGDGYSLFLTNDAVVLALGKAGAETDSIRMRVAGRPENRNGVPMISPATGEAELPGKVNYFIGNDPAKWRTGIPAYAKVRYSSVYPGVDLVYYGNQRKLEYDFVVTPGANPAQIRLEFVGASKIRIVAGGDLILTGALGQAVFHKPVVYQDENGQRKPITGGFTLLAGNTVGFSLGSYDRTRPLIIDPVLAYSTYLGGAGSNGHGDQGNGIAVDTDGSAYVVGTTFSTDFPVTGGAFQATNNATLKAHGPTVFVSKLNSTGTALVFSTYLGGSASDYGYGIALDAKRDIYITGATSSADFPITCAALRSTNDQAASGTTTGFVTKLYSSGGTLGYSTFLGGKGINASNTEVAEAIAVDALGNAYVTGYTSSSYFPATKGAFQTSLAGGRNAFVAKVNPHASALVYATFLGGGGDDYGNAIAIDNAGDAYITGATTSTNFPVTSGAFQTLSKGTNAFVTELNPAGTDEVYSTYLGGSGGDSAQAIALDSNGYAYIAGNTGSSDFPVTSGVVEPAGVFNYAPGSFVTKLNPGGSSLAYSTFLDGQATSAGGLAIDSAGNAYIAGNALPSNVGYYTGFVETPDALPTPSSGGNSVFLVKLDPLASVLNYATLLGGASNDSANAIALDAAGNVYLTGYANSIDFLTTGEAYQSKNNAAAIGSSNAFVSKFALQSAANQTSYPVIPAGTIPVPITLSSPDSDVGCVPGDDPEWYIDIDVALESGFNGPPPTGTLSFSSSEDYFDPSPFGFSGQWGGAASTGVSWWGPVVPSCPDEIFWTGTYSGDSVYQSASVSGDTPCTEFLCSPSGSEDAKPAKQKDALQIQNRSPKAKWSSRMELVSSPTPDGRTLTLSTPPRLTIQAPKFIPLPPGAQSTNGQEAPASVNEAAQACIEPVAPLTVIVLPVTASRLYGAANPSFTTTLTGLLYGDTVNVTPTTTATPASSVGFYPVSATVSGGETGKYAVTVEDSTLQVKPAMLTLIAKSEAITYGQSPALPLQYFFNGLLNGDTASVVSGSPVLSTTVTSTTPVGNYLISAQPGTLTAENYKIGTIGPQAGTGAVRVYKAPLTVTANSVTMTEGGTVPALTYTITGFVNGENASVVSGTASLSTTVTSGTLVGEYPISVDVGPLSAENYYFVPAVHGGVVIVVK